MSYKFQILFLISLIFSGCATRPIATSDTFTVSNDRVIDAQYLQPVLGGGKVIVKRDKGFGGSACSSRIFVDGKPVADIRVSEKVILYLPEGEHILSAWPNGICGGGMSEVKASIKAETESIFRVGYGSNGDFSINPTAF